MISSSHPLPTNCLDVILCMRYPDIDFSSYVLTCYIYLPCSLSWTFLVLVLVLVRQLGGSWLTFGDLHRLLLDRRLQKVALPHLILPLSSYYSSYFFFFFFAVVLDCDKTNNLVPHPPYAPYPPLTHQPRPT